MFKCFIGTTVHYFCRFESHAHSHYTGFILVLNLNLIGMMIGWIDGWVDVILNVNINLFQAYKINLPSWLCFYCAVILRSVSNWNTWDWSERAVQCWIAHSLTLMVHKSMSLDTVLLLKCSLGVKLRIINHSIPSAAHIPSLASSLNIIFLSFYSLSNTNIFHNHSSEAHFWCIKIAHDTPTLPSCQNNSSVSVS